MISRRRMLGLAAAFSAGLRTVHALESSGVAPAEALEGRIYFKGEPRYEDFRAACSWNARKADRYPEAVVLAQNEADVVAAVKLARQRGRKDIMKSAWRIPIGVLCTVALATAAQAQTQRTVLVAANQSSAMQEAANKNVVLDFWRDFFNYREFDEGARLYLASGFRNHDPYEPSDPQRYADFVRKDLGKMPPIPERAKMFVVAEGDLVLLAELGDASQTRFSANLARVRGGKMVEMWYTGATIEPPPGQVLFDKSRENPKAGPADIIGRKVLVPLHPSSSARELANKQLVLDFWRNFYDAHRFEQAAGKYLTTDFREHYSGAPSGAADYVAFEKTQLGASPGSETGKLFVIAEGDLVALAELNENPEASFQVHLLRVNGGRISDHWYSGPTRSAPPPGMDVQPIDKSKDQ